MHVVVPDVQKDKSSNKSILAYQTNVHTVVDDVNAKVDNSGEAKQDPLV